MGTGNKSIIRQKIKGLYLIADDSYPDPAAIVNEAIKGGCRLIQLRSKNMSTANFIETASAINDNCKKVGATFIVNDRVDAAIAVGADGVHLGQDDFPLCEARRLLGMDKIIGVSTHSMEEALSAESGGADYIGFGPVFQTDTKKDALDPRGLSELNGIARHISIPVIAIGGINMDNLQSMIDSRVDGVAIISAVAGSENIAQTSSRLIKMIGDSNGS